MKFNVGRSDVKKSISKLVNLNVSNNNPLCIVKEKIYAISIEKILDKVK